MPKDVTSALDDGVGTSDPAVRYRPKYALCMFAAGGFIAPRQFTAKISTHILNTHNANVNCVDRNKGQVIDRQSITNKDTHNDLKNIPLKRICKFWNKGYCKLTNKECKYLHINLPACRFKEKCFRYDCQFFHEEETQKYPFLGYPQVKRREQPNVRQGNWSQPPWRQNVSQHQSRQNLY